MKYVVGVDLGQAQDYTAVAVAERQHHERVWAVRHLERYQLGMSYVEVIDRIRSLMTRPPLRGQSQLVVDATGCGRPVLDLLRRGGMGCRVVGITIHGGDTVQPDPAISGYRVPKREIVSTLQLLLQQRRLKIAPGLRDAEVLLKEMQSFKVHISESTGHESFGSWRSGDHDDLVLAVGLATWLGQRYSALPPGPPEIPLPIGTLAKEFFAALAGDRTPPNPDLFAVGAFRPALGRPAPGGFDVRPGPTGSVVRVSRRTS